MLFFFFFFFQAEDGIRDLIVTGVQTCALPISDLGEHEPVRVASVPPVAMPGARAEIASPECSEGGPDRLEVGVTVPGGPLIPARAARPFCVLPHCAAACAVSRGCAIFASFALRPACPIGHRDG